MVSKPLRICLPQSQAWSKEGQQFYAVEKDGAMDYLEEHRLSPAPRVELAA